MSGTGFLQIVSVAQTLSFWKYAAPPGELLLWCAFLERRTALAQECRQCGVEISGVALVEIVSLPGIHLEEGVYLLQGQKILQAPANSLSSAVNKGTHRGWISWSLLFGLPKHRIRASHKRGTVFLGQGALVRAQGASNPEEGVDPSSGFGVLNLSCARDKLRRVAVPGVLTTVHPRP